jgi:RNA polymerase sigma-70 factor (ECF subfamily)
MDDRELVRALRDGDEQAFAALVDRHHGPMLRLAQGYVRNRAVAEEVAQEAWLGILEGLDRFEGRSSLRTWMYRILVNRAITRAEREGRSVPFSAIEDDEEPTVDPGRFLGPDHPRFPGQWSSPPASWDKVPEDTLLSDETMKLVAQAIDVLPPAQADVIRLRDVEGWPAVDVCEVLGISEANQRVLLHRARAGVRRALERYLDEEDAPRGA